MNFWKYIKLKDNVIYQTYKYVAIAKLNEIYMKIENEIGFHFLHWSSDEQNKFFALELKRKRHEMNT